MFKLPFGTLPGHWGLKGKTREIAKAEYELEGYELKKRLLEIKADEITEKKDVIVDKIRAEHIRKIFKLYSTGNCSMKYLAKLMKAEGLTTKRGGILGVRQIELILKNPFYYGYQLYKGELYPHKYEPLISYELFLQCQKVKEGYKKTPRKVSEKPFVFQRELYFRKR